MGILDHFLSNPAKKAANLLRTSLKVYIILVVIVVLLINGICRRLFYDNEMVCAIIFAASIVLMIIFMISIINSHFYKLAVLDACQKIVERETAETYSSQPQRDEADVDPQKLQNYKQLFDNGEVTLDEIKGILTEDEFDSFLSLLDYEAKAIYP